MPTPTNLVKTPPTVPPAATQAAAPVPVAPASYDFLLNPSNIGEKYAADVANKRAQARFGKSIADIIAESGAGNVAAAVGSAATDPQTMAIVNPTGKNDGMQWLNNTALFFKGFANNVNKPVDEFKAAELEKIKAETAKLNSEAGGGGKDQTQKIIDDWRKVNANYNNTIEYINKATAAFNANYGQPVDKANPVSDQSLIFAYMKSKAPSMRLTSEGVDEAAAQGLIDAYTVSLFNKFKAGNYVMEDPERKKYMDATLLNKQALDVQYDNTKKWFETQYSPAAGTLQDYKQDVMPQTAVKGNTTDNNDEYRKRAAQIINDEAKKKGTHKAEDVARAKQILGLE